MPTKVPNQAQGLQPTKRKLMPISKATLHTHYTYGRCKALDSKASPGPLPGQPARRNNTVGQALLLQLAIERQPLLQLANSW